MFNKTNTHSLVLRQSLLKEHDEEREVGGCQSNGTQRRRSEERDVAGGSARLRREVRSYHGADEEAERECDADEGLYMQEVSHTYTCTVKQVVYMYMYERLISYHARAPLLLWRDVCNDSSAQRHVSLANSSDEPRQHEQREVVREEPDDVRRENAALKTNTHTVT